MKGYIYGYIKQGYSFEQIKNYLFINNYDKDLIDKSMVEAKFELDEQLKKFILNYVNNGYDPQVVKNFLLQQYDSSIITNLFTKLKSK